jgi:hypothetical protein
MDQGADRGRRVSAYNLLDGEAQSADHPDSFHIPPSVHRYNLEPGAFAKACFDFEDVGSERMWVKITEAEPGRYVGTLASKPCYELLEFGDRVELEPRHIIDIHQAPTPA